MITSEPDVRANTILVMTEDGKTFWKEKRTDAQFRLSGRSDLSCDETPRYGKKMISIIWYREQEPDEDVGQVLVFESEDQDKLEIQKPV